MGRVDKLEEFANKSAPRLKSLEDAVGMIETSLTRVEQRLQRIEDRLQSTIGFFEEPAGYKG